MSLNKSIILGDELDRHNMKKYEFKKIDTKALEEIEKKQESAPIAPKAPTQSQVSMIQSSLEKELIEKLLAKSDDLSNSLNNFQAQFAALQAQSDEREKNARIEGLKEGEMKAKLEIQEAIEKEREKIAKSIAALNETIERVKSQVATLESELSAIALDIAREVIIKEVSESSAKVATAIARELLSQMSGNLNIIIKVNPADFEFLSNAAKNHKNIQIKSDEAIAKGGVVIVSDQGNIDGNIMSRYKILKQSVLESVRGI